jgi:hypothetical protein
MSEWHASCPDPLCPRKCQRVGCTNPDSHFLMRGKLQNNKWTWTHAWECTAAVSVARMAVESLRPGMAPDEVAIARRVVLEALTKLEQAERDGKKWTPEVMEESA